jgi:AcrR family transcriptional regulator
MSSKKKKPTQARSKVMVDSILEAASRILEGKETVSFTTNKIAEVAGVSIGSLYQYFKSKDSIIEDLLFNKFTSTFQNFFDKLEETGDLDEESFIRVMVEAQFEQWNDKSGLHKSLLKNAPKFATLNHLDRNDDRMIEFLKERIKHYNLSHFTNRNIDLALKLAINTVRMGVYFVVTNPERYTAQEGIDEITDLLTSYLIKRQ